jgi:uncharacterized DUF497 family protein
MPYEWDSTKAAANLAKHGVAFEAIEGFDWSTARVWADLRVGDPEGRLLALGLIGSRVYVVVFVVRRTIRIISLRPANAKEAMRYATTD